MKKEKRKPKKVTLLIIHSLVLYLCVYALSGRTGQRLFYRFPTVVLPIFAKKLGSKLDRETKTFTT